MQEGTPKHTALPLKRNKNLKFAPQHILILEADEFAALIRLMGNQEPSLS